MLWADFKDVFNPSLELFPFLKLLLLDELLLFSPHDALFLVLRDLGMLLEFLLLHFGDLLVSLLLHLLLVPEFLDKFPFLLPVLHELPVVLVSVLPLFRLFHFDFLFQLFFLFLPPVAQLLFQVSAALTCGTGPLSQRAVYPFQGLLFLLGFLQPGLF